MRQRLWKHRMLDGLTFVLLLWLAVLAQRRHVLAGGDTLWGSGDDVEYGLGEQAHAPETMPPETGLMPLMLALVLGFAAVNAVWAAAPGSVLAGLRHVGRGPRADNLFLGLRYRELRARGAAGAEAPAPAYLNAFDRRWAVVLLPHAVSWGTPLRAWTEPLADGGLGGARKERLTFAGRLVWSRRLERGSPWVIAHVWLEKPRDERRLDRFLRAFGPAPLTVES